ncbi:MAG: hypothetical protein ABSF72_13950 [Candidatus Sulfotelmatobacter sp.]|jgi:hypothetical protein
MANNPFPCFWFIQRTLKKEAARLMIQESSIWTRISHAQKFHRARTINTITAMTTIVPSKP